MLVGRTGLSPIMVGRSAELDRLVALLGASRVPSVALVAGEAGIGKTRLVQELAARVPPGTHVLAGQADPGAVGRPMELFLESLDGAGVESPADLVDVVRDKTKPAEERARSGIELVRRLTAGATGLVVFEDLHWADSESLSVFEQLAEPDAGRLLVVGTYRPDGLSRRHPTSELLPRLERRHSVTHIHLTRLSQADVSNFLTAVYGQVPSFRVVEALHSRTGGNPFFLEELVATSGKVPCDELDAMPLPWTVAELVRSQLDDLDPDVRRIVTTASVLGRRVAFDVLAAVSHMSEDDLIRLLRAAVDSGLLIETDPDVFGFHHEIAREAIESGTLGREQRRIHEAAFDALREAGSRDHLALARHARGAGRYDDMVEETRLGAHDSLRLGSSYQALQLAEHGLEEADDDLELLSIAARAAWLADLLDDAVDHCDRWLRLAREADDVGEESDALSLRMRLAFEVGDIEAMASFTEALVDVIDRVPTDQARAQAMASVAQSYMLRDQAAATAEWADKAISLADSHGLMGVRLAAMVEKGSMLLDQPETMKEGRALLEEATAEAERTGDHVLAARALNNLIWHARQWSELDEVRELIERMRRETVAAGFDSLADTAQAEALAQLAAAKGDLDTAIACLDDSRRTNPGNLSWSRGRWLAVLRAGLALEAGDLDGAAEFTEMAKPVTERTAAGVIGLDLHLACRRGDLGRARAFLADLLATVTKEDYASPSQAHDLVATGLRAGLAPEELRPLVERVGATVGRRLDPDHPWRRMLDGQLAEAEGRVEDAAGLYADAAARLGTAPGVLAGHRGTAHVGAARCLVAVGRLHEAGTHATAGAEYLRRWRGWRVDELGAVERRLGLGAEPSGPESLTPREREVAALLAEGLTNSQLAERLFISPRTAAVHVSNILAKLGMSSRTEVAAWVAGGGLTPA